MESILLADDIELAGDFERSLDHPLGPTEAEASEGAALWAAIDDLDDASTGLPRLRSASVGYVEARRRANIVRTCLLEAGVPEVSIELQPGRPASGDSWNALNPVAVFSHHIASRPTKSSPTPGLSLVKRGRSDLPGPLANGAAGVDLVYRILTLGLANHPGTGGPLTVTGPLGSYTIPKDSARAYAWGTEFEGGYSAATWDTVYTNKRTGKTMTFREFMGRVNAGLTRAIWLINRYKRHPGAVGALDLSGYHGEHKTWAPGRKPDRLSYTTESGRAEIRRYQEGVEDDVSAKDVWEFKIKPVVGDKAIAARTMLAQAHNRANGARAYARAAMTNSANALAAAQKNKAAIDAIAKTLDPKVRASVAGLLPADADLAPIEAVDIEGADEE